MCLKLIFCAPFGFLFSSYIYIYTYFKFFRGSPNFPANFDHLSAFLRSPAELPGDRASLVIQLCCSALQDDGQARNGLGKLEHRRILTQPMDPENKSLNCNFPTKHVIPESLKFSHWLSEYSYLLLMRKGYPYLQRTAKSPWNIGLSPKEDNSSPNHPLFLGKVFCC